MNIAVLPMRTLLAARWRAVTPLLLLGALCAVATWCRITAEAAARCARPRLVTALPAVPFLEMASLGWREAASDLCWLQAVQYYGEFRQDGNDLSEFEHYLRAVTTLDPRFEHAYVFGAVVLATERHDLPAAMALLQRGAAANPDSPLCPFEMGFLTYVCGGDLQAALRWLQLSGRRPGGRERALRFEAFLNRRLGRLETAWLLWNDVYRTTRDPGMRTVAAESMRRIEEDLLRQRATPALPQPEGSVR